jgi:hypothetical protein
MDTRESKTAWIVAAILLVLLIIVGWLWLSQKNDLGNVLENGADRISAVRDQMKEDCQGPEMDAAACAHDKQQLSDILDDFKSDLMEASTTVTASSSAQ